MTIKCIFNGVVICSIVFVVIPAILAKFGIADGLFDDIPFEAVTEVLNYICAKTKKRCDD